MPWHPTLISSEIFSVHAALVPGGAQGKVVMLGGSEHNPAQGGNDETPASPAQVDRAAVFDVAAKADATKIASPTTDVFCAGHAFTADGRWLVGGGTESWGDAGDEPGGPGGGHVHLHGNFGGHRACWIFNHQRETWDRAADMGFEVGPGAGGGRWYPTILTLPTGDLVAFGGHPSRHSEHWHENDRPERYWSEANAWTWYPHRVPFEHPSLPGNWYPRATLTTGGLVFFTSRHNGKCRLFDPGPGTLTTTEIESPGGLYDSGWDYSVIGLPLVADDGYRSRVMAVGDVTPRVIELDLAAGGATPSWQDAGTRQGSAAGKRRLFTCPVYLPTGQILVSGGINGRNDADAVEEPEVFTPNIDWDDLRYQAGGVGTWQTIEEPAQKARNYHSVALLLPDGSVFVAGSNIDGRHGDPATVAQRNIEIFFPSYYDDPGRPTIAGSPALVTSGQESFSFTMASPAQAAAIGKVALIRCGSVTHAGDFDHRYVALPFEAAAGSASVTATLPGDASVLPPGYYLLWAVDDADRPCQAAPFVRIAHVSCQVVVDRSTFSQEEVASLGPSPGFPFALYATFDGFKGDELPPSLAVELTWADTAEPVAGSDIRVTPTEGRWLEHSPLVPEVAQRITYPYTVEIANPSLFATFPDRRSVHIRFTHGPTSCTGTIDLVKTPNPYMVDVDPVVRNPHWLSTDVRTFRVRAGQTMLGDLTQGTGDDAPEVFAKALIDKLRALPNDGAHPFLALPRDGDAGAIDLAPTEGSARLYNYAVAKVRYRAVTTTAQRVKVFFRLCITEATGLEYDTTRMYRYAATGAATVPGLGKAGDEVKSIPFFLSPRVNTVDGQPGATSMATQPLAAGYEVQDIAPVSSQEVTAYFACWLDVNQPDVKRFPLVPGGGHGPWPAASAQPIQDFLRSPHQCLVAEVFFEPDPTRPGATPGNADNLAQRNLALLHSENPGAPGSRLVVHPFEVKASAFPLLQGALDPKVPESAAFVARLRPDELMVNWHNLPRRSEVTLSFSNVDTADIVRLAALTRHSAPPFTVVDDKTLRLTVGNHSWVPIPGTIGEDIPVLLSVRLPETIRAGDRYRISVHQVDGRAQRVIGSVELSIPVSKAELLVDREVRTLSIMKHIATTIPSTNRWHPIFLRYLAQLGDRVDALGGDAGAVHANPDGSGRPVEPSPEGASGDADDIAAVLEACCRRLGKVGLLIPASIVVSALVRRWLGGRCPVVRHVHPCRMSPRSRRS